MLVSAFDKEPFTSKALCSILKELWAPVMKSYFLDPTPDNFCLILFAWRNKLCSHPSNRSSVQ
jgi:hypothetical protein